MQIAPDEKAENEKTACRKNSDTLSFHYETLIAVFLFFCC